MGQVAVVRLAPGEPAPSPAPSARRPDIQGLRAVAVGMVLAYHAGLPTPGGFTGVDVFFVISGFVITAMLEREWLRNGRLALGRFYLRRFRRLTPALALLLTIILALSPLLLSPLGPQQHALFTGLGALTLSANLVVTATTVGYFDLAAETNAFLHTWSLSVEEQFYLAFPLLLVLAWRLGRRRGSAMAPFVVVGGVIAASVVAAALTAGPAAFYSPFTRAGEFAAGAALALLSTRLPRPSRGFGLVLSVLGAALLGLSLLAISGTTPFPGPWTLAPVAGTVALLAGGLAPAHPVSRILSRPGLVVVGDLSYSLYLWHWPLVVFAVAAWPDVPWVKIAATVISVVPAYLSYRLVEEPLRHAPPAGSRGNRTLVRAVLFPPLVVALGATVAVQGLYASPLVATHAEAARLHVTAGRGCHADDARPWPEADCTWGAGSPGSPVHLVGDSNAEHFSEAVIAAGAALGRPVVISTHGSCPLLPVRVWDLRSSDSRNQACADYVEETLDRLTAAAPGTVVVASSDGYLDQPWYAFGPDRGSAVTDRSARLRAWIDGTARAVVRLQRAGHRVLLIHTVPRWEHEDHWSLAECTGLGLVTRGDAWCRFEMPLARATSRQADARAALAAVAAATQATLFDPGPLICPGGTCVSADGARVSYRDHEHITVAAAGELAPALAVAIKRTG